MDFHLYIVAFLEGEGMGGGIFNMRKKRGLACGMEKMSTLKKPSLALAFCVNSHDQSL